MKKIYKRKFKKKVYLKAYFQSNLGDDMFVRHILARYPEILFKIATNSNNVKAFGECANLKNVSCIVYILDRIINKLFGKHIVNQYIEKASDAMVHIGGSIFIEPENFTSPKNNGIVNTNSFIIGCNFGPCKTDAYRDFVKLKLQKTTDVCFRDTYSYNEFLDICQARVAPDVLFGYFNYPVLKKGKDVGISVINLSERKGLKDKAELYYKTIAKAINRFLSAGRSVKLFSFCEAEGDTKAIYKILEYVDTLKNIDICIYNGDIDGIVEKMNECEYILASRFHAMIIGWTMKKKVYPIIYSMKQIHVIEDIGFTGAMWNLFDEDAPLSDQIVKDCFDISSVFDVSEYIEHSQEQFKVLDKFL